MPGGQYCRFFSLAGRGVQNSAKGRREKDWQDVLHKVEYCSGGTITGEKRPYLPGDIFPKGGGAGDYSIRDASNHRNSAVSSDPDGGYHHAAEVIENP